MSEKTEEKKETETEKTEEKAKTEEHTRSGVAPFVSWFLVIGGVALGLFGLKRGAEKGFEYIEKCNETARALNSQTPEYPDVQNGKNTRVYEFTKNGAVNGIHGRAINRDTGRETGDKLNKTAPETGASAGVNRVGEMVKDPLVKPQDENTSASKTSSGRSATRNGGRNAARVISNTPPKARVLNTHRQGKRIDMTGDATTTRVSVQFGEKTQTAQASKPVINPAAFRDSGGR